MTSTGRSRYIQLLKRVLIDQESIGGHEFHPLPIVQPNWRTAFLRPIDRLLRRRNFAIVKMKYVSAEERLGGLDWPAKAKTMIGMARLDNIEQCIRTILRDDIPGDLMEAGVWRGGAAIFMQAMLKELGMESRRLWLADSFEGLPEPDAAAYPADRGSSLHELRILRIPLKEVVSNFQMHELLDDKVRFLEGWFNDTLPTAPVDQLALLRLDADMYGSTIVALTSLYGKVSEGGFVIIDDYKAIPACRKAVDDFRKEQGITEEMIDIDREAIYWRKGR